MEEVIARLTPERLQELRDCHSLAARPGVPHRCKKCRQLWPCEYSQILDLALEAERLRELAEVRLQFATKWDEAYRWERERRLALAAEAERLRADWGAALDTMSFLRDDLTKARAEAERLREVVRVARFTAVRISNQMVDELLKALADYDARAGTEAK